MGRRFYDTKTGIAGQIKPRIKGVRKRIWFNAVKNLPQGCFFPRWAIALRLALFPVDTVSTLAYKRGYDIFTNVWHVHGARFSEQAMLIMSASIGEGAWYKFTKNEDGIVIVHTEKREGDKA